MHKPPVAAPSVHAASGGGAPPATSTAPILHGRESIAERRAGSGVTNGAHDDADGLVLGEDEDEPAISDETPKSETADVPQEDEKTEREKQIEALQKKIEETRSALRQAVADGDLEKAATLRDELNGLERELDQLTAPPPTAPPYGGGGAPPGGGGAPYGGGGAPPGGGAPYGGGGAPYGGGGAPYGGGGAPYGGGGGAPVSSPGATVPPDFVGSNVPQGEPGSRAERFMEIAKAQQGDAYVAGAEGPDQFDCSGLVCYALNEAGVNVPRLTARGYQERYQDSAVGRDQLKPGDLIFYWYPNDRGIPPGKASHIEIYLGNGMSMGTDSEKEGARVEPVDWKGFIGGARVPELYA